MRTHLTIVLAALVGAAACETPTETQVDEALAGPQFAMSADASASDVIMFGSGAVVGASTLVRNDAGVRMTFQTSGIDASTVATIWWVVFNNPDACEGGIVEGRELQCTSGDFGNPEVDASVFYATGHVIGGSGKANYAAWLPVGRLTVDPDPSANQLIVGDGILDDARGAEIHVVLRTHGPTIPGMVHQQLNTFDAGCTTAPPGLQGPNTCMNLQFATHEP